MTPATEAVDISALGPELFRLAVDACPNGIALVGSDGRILMINGEVERLFGYHRGELCGQPIEILLPEKSRSKHAHQRKGFMIRPSPRRLGTGRDFSGRRKDGSEFPIEVGLSPIQVGENLFLLGSIVDISERKRLERLQDEFVSTVSHELRTPMTSIAAALGLLTGGKAGPLPEPALRLIAIAHENCQRLVRLVNDILDIKKLESGKMTFCLQRCDARLLLEKAIEGNRAIADDCVVNIRLDVLPHACFIHVDPDRFVQVITNLLSNAIKFSPREEEVVVTIDKNGGNFRVTVRDHGSGIPEEFKPRIFDRFAQANAATTKEKGGTGLGLSIARQIAELMHGQIGFDDAPGGGTTFFFDLPSDDQLASWKAALSDEGNSKPIAMTGL
jgi:PAS domain S-box-containing protein